MRVVVLGPQGAGKGTQSARIAAKYGTPIISTGEIFRHEIKSGTPLGLEAKSYVDQGRFVPDEVTIEMVRKRLDADDCHQGFLLDGFPRNVNQARALDEVMERRALRLDAALLIEVPAEITLTRIVSRRVCTQCGRNYGPVVSPATGSSCKACGAEVEARSDDLDEEAIRERLKLYREQTEPLKSYYKERGLLHMVDGTTPPDEVFADIERTLEARIVG